MDPEFGVGVGSETGAGRPPRPRPTLLVRGMEMVGLALVIYGLGAYRFGFAAVGGVMIVGSYALYRRKHGAGPASGSDGGPMDADGDSGGGGD